MHRSGVKLESFVWPPPEARGVEDTLLKTMHGGSTRGISFDCNKVVCGYSWAHIYVAGNSWGGGRRECSTRRLLAELSAGTSPSPSILLRERSEEHDRSRTFLSIRWRDRRPNYGLSRFNSSGDRRVIRRRLLKAIRAGNSLQIVSASLCGGSPQDWIR